MRIIILISMYICTHIHAYTPVYNPTYIHTHTPVYTYTCTYVHTYIDPSVNLRICLHTYTLVCVRCVFIRTYIFLVHTYVRTYMHAYVHTVHPSMYLRTHMYVPMYALVGTHAFGVYKQGGWNANHVHSFSFW